jgi:hypothetical protein
MNVSSAAREQDEAISIKEGAHFASKHSKLIKEFGRG